MNHKVPLDSSKPIISISWDSPKADLNNINSLQFSSIPQNPPQQNAESEVTPIVQQSAQIRQQYNLNRTSLVEDKKTKLFEDIQSQYHKQKIVS